MAHVTTFEFQALPGQRDAVIGQFRRWDREQKSKATGFQYSLLVSSNAEPDRFVAVVGFDTTDNYNKNSDRAETAAWYQSLRACLVADPTWFDGTVAIDARA